MQLFGQLCLGGALCCLFFRVVDLVEQYKEGKMPLLQSLMLAFSPGCGGAVQLKTTTFQMDTEDL